MEVSSVSVGQIIIGSGEYQPRHNETRGVFRECSLKLKNVITRTKIIATSRLVNLT